VKPLGELKHVPIMIAIWIFFLMDFIVGLPKYGNESIIMIVVDFLSKHAHFCALQHPFKSSKVTQVFMDNIFKLHCILQSIVMDHDPTFIGNFLQE
jgi:hypothetical protein